MCRYFAKAPLLFIVLFAGVKVIAQTDTLECEKYFNHFDNVQQDQLIFLWEEAPTLKEFSYQNIDNTKKIVAENTSLENVFASIIIDSNGIPICFRFYPQLTLDIEGLIKEELMSIRFNPALQRGKGVKSIYTLKISF